MSIDHTKRRARRIAADEAHAWARNLRVGNPLAKLVLSMLTLYVNDEGFCTTSIPTLAEDCEFAPDTVRRRLAWLEEIGAIVRFPQWVDDKGRRNGDGRGKRTTDLIRLMIEADTELIERRAAGHDDGDGEEVVQTTISPGHQQGLNPGEESVSPALGLCQPSQSGEGLISEPEPESPPKSPPPGARESDPAQGEEQKIEHLAEFRRDYPKTTAWDWSKAEPVFSVLSEQERLQARLTAPLYAKQTVRDRPPPVHPAKFLKAHMFNNWPAQNPPEATQHVFIAEDSDEYRGLCVAFAMTKFVPPRVANDAEHGRGYWRSRPVRDDVRALAAFDPRDRANWPLLEANSREFQAWRDRLHEWTGCWIEPEKEFLEPFDEKVHALTPMSDGWRVRRSMMGLRAPRQWPPRKDGTFGDESGIEGAAA